MLGSMLGAHPRYLCTPESYFKFDLLRDADRRDAAVEAFRAGPVPEHYLVDWGVDLREVEPASGAAGYQAILQHIVDCYAKREDRDGYDVWVDHTPVNAMFADQLFERFPDARVVHIVRDGRAVAASLLSVDWGPRTALDAADFWCRKVASGLAAELAWGPQRVARVSYEELILDPEGSLRRLCDQLGLEFDEAMTQGGGFRQVSQWKDVHTLVGKPPSADRIHAWKKKLGERDRELFEWKAREMLAYLGYETEFGLDARGPTRGERFGAWWRTTTGRVLQGVSRRRRTRRAAREARRG